MTDATDMSTPVTRGELREEFAQFEQKLDRKLDQRFAQFEQKLEHFATKRELELWGGTLLARMESFEHRLLAELAQHTKAISESLSAQISIIDEKYAELPARVKRLETEVFPPTQR